MENTVNIYSIDKKILYSHKCVNNTLKITLEKAISENSDLRHADLEGADLEGADLADADLRHTDLCNANLRHADLDYCIDYYSFIAYDTSKRIVHCVKYDNTWMIKAGCFWGTLQELEEKVRNTHNSQVYKSNINILKQL